MAISILKVILVLIILSTMIIVLMTINHFLAHGFESDDDDMEELKRDIDERKEVITDKSSFHQLVKVNHTYERKKENYKK